MIPDPSYLKNSLNLEYPLIGLYDLPDVSKFDMLIRPRPNTRQCIFQFFSDWCEGETLHLTKENHGCRGCARYFWSIEPMDHKSFISFLVDEEGLKASHELMEQWIENGKTYKSENNNILIGPLQPHDYDYIKTITFYVNPDQLSALMIGAQYFSKPDDPVPVLAPFGSGCGEILPLFKDLEAAQAIIGSTDLAMRRYLPPELMAFTVTKKMFQQLCELDTESFLNKPFLGNLKKSRGGRLN